MGIRAIRAAAVTGAVIWSVSSAAAAAPIGPCRFDSAALAFAGTPQDQASCLLRPVARYGRVATQPLPLPDALGARVGRPTSVDVGRLRQHMASLGLGEDKLGSLTAPVSRTAAGVKARYFVIHDTSWPNLGEAPFPADLDSAPSINRLAGYAGVNAVAHYFVNRKGEVLRGHDFATPWRATKLETQAVGTTSRGLFLHIESIQPRRRDPAGGAHNDALAPSPGFSAAQYERLALLYVIASVRAGTWLIPGYHAAIDEGLSDGHDDPQSFDLARFDAALAALVAQVGG